MKKYIDGKKSYLQKKEKALTVSVHYYYISGSLVKKVEQYAEKYNIIKSKMVNTIFVIDISTF